MWRSIILLLMVILMTTLSQRTRHNPCRLFTKFQKSNGVNLEVPYDGSRILSLQVNTSLTGVWKDLDIRLKLSTPTYLVLGNHQIKYHMYFPENENQPKITGIQFNNNILCHSPPEPSGPEGVTNTWTKLTYEFNSVSSGNDDMANGISQVKQQCGECSCSANDDKCGVPNSVKTATIDNEYPWAVALFLSRDGTHQYGCNAILISDNYVLTAAHCVHEEKKGPSVQNHLLVLGRYDIEHWRVNGATVREAASVKVHPNYKRLSSHADIALIKLNQSVPYQPNIRPICLRREEPREEVGIFVGWMVSFDGNPRVPQIQKMAMPIVSDATCLRSHEAFAAITSNGTFCAGNRNGLCPPNSGAAFMVQRNDKYILRGFVASALVSKDNSKCHGNGKEYFVFVDVFKFYDWIRQSMAED